jgi:metal-sulfur cluster biosynthetic enzyme
VYREDPLFVALRDPSRLGGHCGRCEYRERCGGSRARAYAATGDPLAGDPGCAWEPARPGSGEQSAPSEPQHAPASGITRRQVLDALRSVVDPELGLSVVDLGLIYQVAVRGGRVSVTMTLTTPGCPIHDVMPEWVRRAVLVVPGVECVDVTLTFDPPWTPERIGQPPLAPP